MAANGQMVNTTLPAVSYGGNNYRILRGTIIDVPAGSALQTAIGAGNLTALTAQQTGGSPGDTEPELNSYVPAGLSYNPGQN